MGLHRCHFFADRPERAIELSEISHHEQQITKAEFSGFDIQDAEVKHARHANGCQQGNSDPISAFHKRLLNSGLHSFIRLLHETALLALFLAECPHDSD